MNTTAFLFPGQGAFYGGVLRDTRLFYPAVQSVLERVEAVVLARMGRSLTSAMWNSNSSAEYLLKNDPALLQLAIFSVSVAAFEMLTAEGVQPKVLVGHSLGEIAALTCAGAFTLEQGAHIVCDRIESLQQHAPADGCMASISANSEKVQALIDIAVSSDSLTGLTIAVENHAGQTVISGPRSAVIRFTELCTSQEVSNQLLNAPYAFHHPSLVNAQAHFAQRLSAYQTYPLQIPVYSPILCRFYQPSDNLGQLIAHHLVVPVKFSTAVHQLVDAGVNLFIEAGALNALSKIVTRILGPGRVKVFPTLENNDDELVSIRTIIQHLQKDIVMSTPQTFDLASSSPVSSGPTFNGFSSNDFENYWNLRAPVLMAQIKAEFLGFFANQTPRSPIQSAPVAPLAAPAVPVNSAPVAPLAASAVPVNSASVAPLNSASVVPIVAPVKTVSAPTQLPRSVLYMELVSMYADAMEYPAEVFSEAVELEAELGIDSVKQTEIIGRIRTQYNLPPLPANFRSGDFKTMGQIVDFVFAQQGQALATA